MPFLLGLRCRFDPACGLSPKVEGYRCDLSYATIRTVACMRAGPAGDLPVVLRIFFLGPPFLQPFVDHRVEIEVAAGKAIGQEITAQLA